MAPIRDRPGVRTGGWPNGVSSCVCTPPSHQQQQVGVAYGHFSPPMVHCVVLQGLFKIRHKLQPTRLFQGQIHGSGVLFSLQRSPTSLCCCSGGTDRPAAVPLFSPAARAQSRSMCLQTGAL